MDEELKNLGQEFDIIDQLEMIIQNQKQILDEIRDGHGRTAVLLALQGQNLTTLTFIKLIARLLSQAGSPTPYRVYHRDPTVGKEFE